jgi:hypothetical protein
LTQTDDSNDYCGSTDPDYVNTNQWLAYFRLQLQNRAMQFGSRPTRIVRSAATLGALGW